MAKFMIQASYTADGTKGLLKEGGCGAGPHQDHASHQS